MKIDIAQVADKLVSGEFLEKVLDKYHYRLEDYELLTQVAEQLSPIIRTESMCQYILYQPEQPLYAVVITLGAGVDKLQDEFSAGGLFSESYMVEALASELLLTAYELFNKRFEKVEKLHVARYWFPGSTEEYSLELMAQILEKVSGESKYQVEDVTPERRENAMENVAPESRRDTAAAAGGSVVTCNEAFCLTPKKSVVFLAEATADDKVQCAGVCMGCNRKDCPNRMENSYKMQNGWGDHAAALNYGFRMIFGMNATE